MVDSVNSAASTAEGFLTGGVVRPVDGKNNTEVKHQNQHLEASAKESKNRNLSW
jgi:hypothetical protein